MSSAGKSSSAAKVPGSPKSSDKSGAPPGKDAPKKTGSGFPTTTLLARDKFRGLYGKKEGAPGKDAPKAGKDAPGKDAPKAGKDAPGKDSGAPKSAGKDSGAPKSPAGKDGTPKSSVGKDGSPKSAGKEGSGGPKSGTASKKSDPAKSASML